MVYNDNDKKCLNKCIWLRFNSLKFQKVQLYYLFLFYLCFCDLFLQLTLFNFPFATTIWAISVSLCTINAAAQHSYISKLISIQAHRQPKLGLIRRASLLTRSHIHSCIYVCIIYIFCRFCDFSHMHVCMYTSMLLPLANYECTRSPLFR